jgi:16S rRNA (uracil1498-N3)-methyltransferase
VSAPAAPAATIYARGPFQAGGVIILDDDEANHLRVRRVEDGDAVRLVDGRGGIATARVAKDHDLLAARVVATTLISPPPTTEVWVGAGDRDRFLSVVEKATELGATRVLPLITEHSQQVATRFQALHVEKASKRAREAIKQCGAAWAPALGSPLPIAEALRTPAPRAMVRMLADPGGGPLPRIREADAVQWAIGPEGGFTDTEIAALKAAGFRSVALGRATLRFDTAALAALALTAQARLGSPQQGSAG